MRQGLSKVGCVKVYLKWSSCVLVESCPASFVENEFLVSAESELSRVDHFCFLPKVRVGNIVCIPKVWCLLFYLKWSSFLLPKVDI